MAMIKHPEEVERRLLRQMNQAQNLMSEADAEGNSELYALALAKHDKAYDAYMRLSHKELWLKYLEGRITQLPPQLDGDVVK